MKIIKEGDLTRLNALCRYRAECPRCGCVFEFKWNEANHTYGYNPSHFVTCPTCKEVMDMMSEYVQKIKI